MRREVGGATAAPTHSPEDETVVGVHQSDESTPYQTMQHRSLQPWKKRVWALTNQSTAPTHETEQHRSFSPGERNRVPSRHEPAAPLVLLVAVTPLPPNSYIAFL